MRQLAEVFIPVLVVGYLVAAVAVALEREGAIEPCKGPYAKRAPTLEELAMLLRNHQAWLNSGGEPNDMRRANLCQANLLKARWYRANFREANLSEANLEGADLAGANLQGADLAGANLQEAHLSGANLQGAHLARAYLIKAHLIRADLLKAHLIRADLLKANLIRADLLKANLSEANLEGARLTGANLQEAGLAGAILREANLSEANLQGADLTGANLQGADLIRADLLKAHLSEANLEGARLTGANLREARLTGANLQEADLAGANLQEARLLRANLQEADLAGANLQGVLYEPDSGKLPMFVALTDPRNHLDRLVFHDLPASLIALREAFKKAGMRTQERQLTYAIEHTKMLQAWDPSWYAPGVKDERPWLEKLAGKSESLFSYVLFELPSGYGMVPSRALATLGFLILVFSLVYMAALLIARGRAGIWVMWPTDRVYQEEGAKEATRVTSTFFFPRFQARAAGHWWGVLLRGVSVPLIGLYFSLVSAFSLGWRELNVGTWIARVQPREYVLRATGWVRTVAGLQSLLSVYLLALWVLTYFGRPFE